MFIFRALLMVWVFLRKSPQWSPHPFPDYLCSPSVLGPWSAFPRVLLRSRRPKQSQAGASPLQELRGTD